MLYYVILYSQQQNALGYNLSMQGIGTVAIDGPRLEPGSDVSQEGLANNFVLTPYEQLRMYQQQNLIEKYVWLSSS